MQFEFKSTLPAVAFGRVPSEDEVQGEMWAYRAQDFLQFAAQIAASCHVEHTSSKIQAWQYSIEPPPVFKDRISRPLLDRLCEGLRGQPCERFQWLTRSLAIAFGYLGCRFARGRGPLPQIIPDKIVVAAYDLAEKIAPRPKEDSDSLTEKTKWIFRTAQACDSIVPEDCFWPLDLADFLTNNCNLHDGGKPLFALASVYAIVMGPLMSHAASPLNWEVLCDDDTVIDAPMKSIDEYIGDLRSASVQLYGEKLEREPLVSLGAGRILILDPVSFRSQVILAATQYARGEYFGKKKGSGLEDYLSRELLSVPGFQIIPTDSEKRCDFIYRVNQSAILIECKALIPETSRCFYSEEDAGKPVDIVESSMRQIAITLVDEVRRKPGCIRGAIPLIISYNRSIAACLHEESIRHLMGIIGSEMEKCSYEVTDCGSAGIRIAGVGVDLCVARPQILMPALTNKVLRHIAEKPEQRMEQLQQALLSGGAGCNPLYVFPELDMQLPGAVQCLARSLQALYPSRFARENPGGIDQFLANVRAECKR